MADGKRDVERWVNWMCIHKGFLKGKTRKEAVKTVRACEMMYEEQERKPKEPHDLGILCGTLSAGVEICAAEMMEAENKKKQKPTRSELKLLDLTIEKYRKMKKRGEPVLQMALGVWAQDRKIFSPPSVGGAKGPLPGGGSSLSPSAPPYQSPGGGLYPQLALHGVLDMDVQPSDPLKEKEREQLNKILTRQVTAAASSRRADDDQVWSAKVLEESREAAERTRKTLEEMREAAEEAQEQQRQKLEELRDQVTETIEKSKAEELERRQKEMEVIQDKMEKLVVTTDPPKGTELGARQKKKTVKLEPNYGYYGQSSDEDLDNAEAYVENEKLAHLSQQAYKLELALAKAESDTKMRDEDEPAYKQRLQAARQALKDKNKEIEEQRKRVRGLPAPGKSGLYPLIPVAGADADGNGRIPVTYKPLSCTDLQYLKTTLPPLQEGGRKWFRTLQLQCANAALAVGDVKGLVAACAPQHAADQIMMTAGLGGTPLEQPFDQYAQHFVTILDAVYPPPNPQPPTFQAYKGGQCPTKYMEECVQAYISSMQVHPYRNPQTTCLFLQGVLDVLPEPIKTSLASVPGLTSDSNLFLVHFKHHIDQFNKKEREREQNIREMQDELLKNQLSQLRQQATAQRKGGKEKPQGQMVVTAAATDGPDNSHAPAQTPASVLYASQPQPTGQHPPAPVHTHVHYHGNTGGRGRGNNFRGNSRGRGSVGRGRGQQHAYTNNKNCFQCGGQDHWARDCPQKGCFNCGGTDHWARDCTQPARPNYQQQGGQGGNRQRPPAQNQGQGPAPWARGGGGGNNYPTFDDGDSHGRLPYDYDDN